MASVVSQLIEEVTAHAQSDSLEDAREICADGTYFLNDLRTYRTSGCARSEVVQERKIKKKKLWCEHARTAIFSAKFEKRNCVRYTGKQGAPSHVVHDTYSSLVTKTNN